MDNKQAYAITTQVFNTLVKLKMLTGDKTQNRHIKDTIFNAVQSTPIKETRNTDTKQKKEVEEFELSKKLATDREYARGWLIQQLAKNTISGNAQAAKEVRDLLGIGADDDLKVVIVDYSQMPADDPLMERPELPELP